MFAIFLSDKMDPFYAIILSFPTLIFSILLLFCALFWLIAILGMIDISFLDLPDVDGDMDSGSDGNSTPDAVAAIILKLGLNGVPLTIVITLISLLGWLISYYLVDFSFGYIANDWFRYALGSVYLVLAIYIAALITAQIIKPLRPLFKKLEQNVEKLVMGQTAVVRTSLVDNSFGEADLDDGGAGLILKVRSTGDQQYHRGDRVVLIEYLKEQNAFRVVSEQEFQGL